MPLCLPPLVSLGHVIERALKRLLLGVQAFVKPLVQGGDVFSQQEPKNPAEHAESRDLAPDAHRGFHLTEHDESGSSQEHCGDDE